MGGVQSATQSDAPNYLTTLKDLVDQDPQFESILRPLIRSNDATVSPGLTMAAVPPVPPANGQASLCCDYGLS